MKTLRDLIDAKQWQAVQATIDALIESQVLSGANPGAQPLAGEHLHGTLGRPAVGRDLVVMAVMSQLRREPLALPHTPGAEPLRILIQPQRRNQ